MSWGGFVNSITGASHSAKQQYQYNLALQQQNQAWQEKMVNTAHQREVADLKEAGLNPVLSAGGNGASGGVPGGGGVGGGVPQNPLELINGIVNTYATAKQTQNNTAKTNADIANETALAQANVNKILKEAGYTEKQIEYYNKYGVFPGATVKLNAGGSVSGPFGAGISMQGGGEMPVGLKTLNPNKKENEPVSAKKTKELKGLKGLY